MWTAAFTSWLDRRFEGMLVVQNYQAGGRIRKYKGRVQVIYRRVFA
jgi:hypothetical protein